MIVVFSSCIALSILIFLSYDVKCICAAAVSYTANGVWEEDTSSSQSNHPGDSYMQTPSKKVWKPSYDAKLFDNVTACDALVKKGITKIFFHGDSFMRQMYAAFLITLNGDYRYGSLSDPTTASHCEYHRQFNEKNCGTRQLNHYAKVCGDKIILDPILAGFSNDNHCSNQPGTVIMWSFGNYKLVRYGRAGVNNATAYQEFFERDVCPMMREKSATYSGVAGGNSACSVWWVSTHYRMKAHFDDETPEIVKDYNEGMRKFYDSGGCGNVNYVDVYNTTAQLALHHKEDAEQMTYDGVHWGYEVNLIKAQILINALLSSQ